MLHLASKFVLLAGVWLLLSGHYTPLMLSFGVVSCALVIVVAARMKVIDAESHPLHMILSFPVYLIWLIKEIVVSNIDVTRRILDPRLPIDPRLFEVDTSQSSDLGRVIYANSITLTPGTVSTDVDQGRIQVHALSGDGEAALRTGEMDRKVTALEGSA